MLNDLMVSRCLVDFSSHLTGGSHNRYTFR